MKYFLITWRTAGPSEAVKWYYEVDRTGAVPKMVRQYRDGTLEWEAIGPLDERLTVIEGDFPEASPKDVTAGIERTEISRSDFDRIFAEALSQSPLPFKQN